MQSQGSKSHPGVPTWARGAANFLFGDPNSATGFMGDATTGQNAVNFNDLLAGLMPAMQAGVSGGAVQRDMASGLTNQAVGATGQIAGGSQAALGDQALLMNQVPNMFNAANQFAGNINQGEGAYNTALGAANQSLNNVMNPTLYNPLFQNAVMNQIAPTTNAQFAARGLGSSGAPVAAITSAATGLADQFAQRQFQEQQQAQAGVTNIGNSLVQSGVQGAQLPGQIFNQFMTGMGQGQQNYQIANQNQLAPLQALGMGSEQFWQGVNNPMQSSSNMYALSRQPMGNLLTGVTGVAGGISAPHIGPVGKMLGK